MTSLLAAGCYFVRVNSQSRSQLKMHAGSRTLSHARPHARPLDRLDLSLYSRTIADPQACRICRRHSDQSPPNTARQLATSTSKLFSASGRPLAASASSSFYSSTGASSDRIDLVLYVYLHTTDLLPYITDHRCGFGPEICYNCTGPPSITSEASNDTHCNNHNEKADANIYKCAADSSKQIPDKAQGQWPRFGPGRYAL
jgi:hypothetical protein